MVKWQLLLRASATSWTVSVSDRSRWQNCLGCRWSAVVPSEGLIRSKRKKGTKWPRNNPRNKTGDGHKFATVAPGSKNPGYQIHESRNDSCNHASAEITVGGGVFGNGCETRRAHLKRNRSRTRNQSGAQWNIRLSLMLNFAHFQICESLTWLVHSLQPPARSCAEIAPHYRLIELLRALCDFSVDEESQNKGFRHNTSEWYSAPLRIHRCTSRIRFYSPVSDYLQHIPGMLVLRSLLAPGSHSI
ncbi:hypothetical protein GEV33_011394 [Tenebrio molitor]|uniref:Uncharacterized protein n=1 Tax=Tenebrio molitor TaxID=7067 RepID=A0A8J6L856_TENMO|nr:hypothetical protein GEV33_011394 [Tenebrio molitor]